MHWSRSPSVSSHPLLTSLFVTVTWENGKFLLLLLLLPLTVDCLPMLVQYTTHSPGNEYPQLAKMSAEWLHSVDWKTWKDYLKFEKRWGKKVSLDLKKDKTIECKLLQEEMFWASLAAKVGCTNKQSGFATRPIWNRWSVYLC